MIDFKKEIENMKDLGFSPNPDLVYIAIPEAKANLWHGLRHFMGDSAQWQPEYDKVAEWLSGNNGRGLLCLGNCGRGKTLICEKIIPVLITHCHNRIVNLYDAQQMNAKIDEIKKWHIIYVDDIGTEGISVRFGERRMTFPELVDEAEKRGKLLMITTNLSIDELKEKYGERTIDRLRAITTPITFVGESMRK